MRAIEATPITTTSAVVTRMPLGLPHENDSYRPAHEDALTEPGTPESMSGQVDLPRAKPRSRVLVGGLVAAGLALCAAAFYTLRSGAPVPPPEPGPPSVATLVPTPTNTAPAPAPTVALEAIPPLPTTATTQPQFKKAPKHAGPRVPPKRPEDLFSRK